MQIKYLNAIIKILEKFKQKKTLLLIDEYYTETTFKKDTECKDIKSYLEEHFSKNLKIIHSSENLKDLEGLNFDLIINSHFSANYSDQIEFVNQIFKYGKVSSFFLNILPFTGFINYNCQTYNPIIFEKLNINDNFLFEYFSFIDNYGNQLVIQNNFLDKLFSQTTENKNQNHLDEVYKNIVASKKDTSMICLSKIRKINPINNPNFIPKRLPHYLSGHGLKTWVDKGALNKILEIIKVKSLVDIGCGPGGVVYYAKKIGLDAIGIDGDSSINRVDENLFVIHDYCLGPYIPDKIFDLGWSVEFLEHVEEKFQKNYFETFKKCKYIFITHAPENSKGYNHVNLKDSNYWIDVFKKYSFEYQSELTQLIRSSSTIEKNFVKEYGLFFSNKDLKND